MTQVSSQVILALAGHTLGLIHSLKLPVHSWWSSGDHHWKGVENAPLRIIPPLIKELGPLQWRVRAGQGGDICTAPGVEAQQIKTSGLEEKKCKGKPLKNLRIHLHWDLQQRNSRASANSTQQSQFLSSGQTVMPNMNIIISIKWGVEFWIYFNLWIYFNDFKATVAPSSSIWSDQCCWDGESVSRPDAQEHLWVQSSIRYK